LTEAATAVPDAVAVAAAALLLAAMLLLQLP
jgi:hypothetical protein